MTKQSTQLKYRKKALAIASMNKKNIIENNTLEDQIEKLKSRIKNCESDLNGMFKNNITIENKLNNLKNQLKKMENKKYDNNWIL